MMSVIEDVFSYVDENRDRYVELVKRLVSQPSVSATGEGINECADLVAEALEEHGVRAYTYTDHGGSPVVFGEVKAEAHATIMFYNHYDVQPPEPLDEWVSDPFNPKVAEGMIVGRGTADNKGNIAARIAAVDALFNTLGEVPVNVKFLIEGEEEVGSPSLARFVELHQQLLFADGCVWEYGYRDKLGRPVLNLGVKGLLYVELEVREGRGDLHSSWGALVENPAWRLVKALSTLRDERGRVMIDGFYDDVEEPGQRVLEMLERIPAEVYDASTLFGARVLEVENPARRLLLEPACNVCGLYSGYIGAGSKTVLPAKASAKLDFRLVPRQRPEDILAKLKKHLSNMGYGDVEVRMLQGYPAARTDPDEPLVELITSTAAEVYETEPVVLPSGYASGPMYIITNTLGIPCVSTGVGYYGSKPHAPNENIRIQDLITGIKHIALTMLRFHRALH
ncbi:MAG TPA: M20/M25/M40 family metallo-hydrolase [Aigarchaeota archaeon]|nr:M20/M25/M40 family metallo-hydrolase [Aigarchaeota archaeon]